jgi:hypothetical protein
MARPYRLQSENCFYWGDRQDIQDEDAGSEQGRYKDREVDGEKHEDKESGK